MSLDSKTTFKKPKNKNIYNAWKFYNLLRKDYFVKKESMIHIKSKNKLNFQVKC